VPATHEAHLPAQRGHQPVIPPRCGQFPGNVDEALIEALRSIPLTDLSDAVGRFYTMSARLRPLYTPMRRIIGTALTVKALPGDNWAIHGALRLARPGTVLVVDWRSTSEACGAGVSALLPAIRRGLTGLVIDGAWRDVPELRAIGFPLIATGTSPFSPSKDSLGEINVPVSCGGVVVQPGDVIVGDEEGTVVLPREFAGRVAESVTGHHVLASAEDFGNDENQDDVARLADQYWSRFDEAGGVRG
jgi:regulator of RNase E activity RraA